MFGLELVPQHKVLQRNKPACLTSTTGGILLAKTIDTHVVLNCILCCTEIQASNLYVTVLTGCSEKKHQQETGEPHHVILWLLKTYP